MEFGEMLVSFLMVSFFDRFFPSSMYLIVCN